MMIEKSLLLKEPIDENEGHIGCVLLRSSHEAPLGDIQHRHSYVYGREGRVIGP